MSHLGLNFPAGRGASNGRSPIWPAGRVAYNGRLATAAIDVRKRQIEIGEAALGGGSDDSVWLMQRHHIAVQERPRRGRRGDASDTVQDIDIYVTDCANGFGKKGESIEELNQRIHGAFVVAGQIMSEGQREAIALQCGGLQTIPNTGPYAIKVGQYICVSAPDPKAPQPYPSRVDIPVNKLLWWVVPFDHLKSVGNVDSAYELLTGRAGGGMMSELAAREYAKQYPASAQFASGLGRAVETLTMVGVIAALEAGMVQLVEQPQWAQTATEFRALTEDDHERTIHVLAREFLTTDNEGGVLRLNDRAEDANYTPHTVTDKSDSSQTRRINFHTYLQKSAFARDGNYRWFKSKGRARNTGAPTYNNPMNRQLVDRQQACVPELVATLRAADVEAKRLIIGQAKGPANPGQDFDIYLGTGMI